MKSDIKSIYPTNILVRQLDIPEDELIAIEAWLRTQHIAFNSSVDPTNFDYGNGDIIEHGTSLGDAPVMTSLVEKIKRGFVDLAYSNIDSYDDNIGEKVILVAEIESCKINLMKTNDRKGNHSHYGDDAFACFYFNDGDVKQGGQLALYDPRWQRNYWFGGSKLEAITPKRGMLVIAPGFMWHEVTQYTGMNDRLALVINAQVFNKYKDLKQPKVTPHT